METNGRGRVSQLVFADDREIIVFVRLSVDGRGRKIPITRIFDVVGIRWTVYASSDDRNKRVKNKFFQNLQKKKKNRLHYLPPARPPSLKYSLYLVLTGFTGLVQLHVRLTQLSEMQEKFVIS